jgi:predicted RNA binding protein YcfA (HicA-like mRNA interferase family)
MTRLPMVSARKMIKALERAGFVADGQKGSHFYLWHPLTKILTSVPVHPGDLKRSLVRAILNQTGITEDEFRKLL